MVAVDKLSFGGPKLRQFAPLQPPRRRRALPLLPDDVEESLTLNSTASQPSPLFLPESFQSGPPDCLNPTPTQPATSHNILQRPHNLQTTSQVQRNDHHQERTICETGGEKFVDEGRTEGSPIPTLSLSTPPLGPSNGQATGFPPATMAKVPSRARKFRFSSFSDERVSPLPTPWSIRHPHHLRTTLQQVFTIPYALPPDFDDIADGCPS